MKRILGGRGTGKTTKIIQKAIEDDAVIVVPAFRCIDNVLHLAEKLGCKDKVKCITFSQFVNGQTMRILPPDHYYIDELDWCLSSLGVIGYSNTEEEDSHEPHA